MPKDAPYGPGLYTGLRIRTLITDWNDVDDATVEIPIGHGARIGNYNPPTNVYEILWDRNAAREDMGWCLWEPDEIRAMATCGGARLPEHTWEGK